MILRFVAVSVIINIVSLTLGVKTFVEAGWGRAASQNPAKEKAENKAIACIKCPEGELTCRPIKKLRTNIEDEDAYCASSSEQLSDLLEFVMLKPPEEMEPASQQRRKEEGQPEILNTNLSRPSAHKRLLPSENFAADVPIFGNKTVTLIMNATHHEEMEHIRGVNVSELGYEIVHSGLYHVYSSIRFKPDSGHPCSEYMFQTWEQTVIKTPSSGAEEETILRSLYTCCDHCTNVKETSYAGGAFRLQPGDKIKVTVSGHGLVDYRRDSSFFGLTMLSTSVTL